MTPHSSSAAGTPGLLTHGRRLWARILPAVALALILLLLTAELGLRYVLGLGNPVLMQPDAAAAYVLKPNQHVYRFFRHTDVNAFSMRSPSFSPAKPAGSYRVLLIGDSMTYGSTQIDQASIFASLLRAELPRQLRQPVEILNASASAWAIANEAGYLESRGAFHSDLVVLVLNTGDSLQPPATLADVGGGAALVKPACALCEVWTRYLRDRLLHGAPKTDAGTVPTPAQMANAAPNLLRLEHFYQLTQQQHTRMAVVFLAMRQYVADGTHASAPDKLQAWAEAHHVPVVDTTGVESALPAAQITLDGLHFNQGGHRVIATYLEQHWDELDPGRLGTSGR